MAMIYITNTKIYWIILIVWVLSINVNKITEIVEKIYVIKFDFVTFNRSIGFILNDIGYLLMEHIKI